MSNTIILKDNQAEQIDVYHYPDGQKSICLKLDQLDVKKPVHVKCRIRNFSELEVLIALVTALKRSDFYLERIDYIYLFGMRSDRAFKPGGSSYFKDVLLPILKSFGEKYTGIFCPHNKIILNLMNAALYRTNKEFVDIKNKVWIGGDSGALFIENTFNENNMEPKGLHFTKKRANGSIIVELDYDDLSALEKLTIPILIVDDLCDAGGTFLAEARYLREMGITAPLNLFVAHGLFTKELSPLLKLFDHIYCTNSYQDIDHPRVTQLKVI